MREKLHLYEDGRRTLLRAVTTGAYAFEEREKTEIADEVWELHSKLTELTDECDSDVRSERTSSAESSSYEDSTSDYRLVITVEEET